MVTALPWGHAPTASDRCRTRPDAVGLFDWPLIDAAEEALSLLEGEPTVGYPLRGRLRGLYFLRVGSYRIIYRLADDGNSVRVVAVRHRGAAYRSDAR